MLVLSRQKNESIMIGDEIEITIVDVKGDKIRVGITAPKHVTVHRKEVYLAIKEENIAAAKAAAADLGALGDLLGGMAPGASGSVRAAGRGAHGKTAPRGKDSAGEDKE